MKTQKGHEKCGISTELYQHEDVQNILMTHAKCAPMFEKGPTIDGHNTNKLNRITQPKNTLHILQ